ncbi:putative permease [Marinovum algicola DG 898]|nr:putative permease [Marinovum algicola DG 898]
MPDTMLLIQMFVLLTVIGGFAGVLAGLLGVGGGIVLVPAFFYAFQTLGYDGPQLMQMCLATSLATIIVTSMRSVLSHNRKGAVDWGILRTWAPGIAIGAVLGVLAAASLRSVTLQALFGVLGIVIGLYLGFGRAHWRLGDAMPGGLRRAVMSPAMGFLSVLMGIGGGSFGVPLMSLYNVPIHRAVATAAGFGAVNLVAFGIVIAMTLITAPLGVRIAHAMDPKPLKRVFAAFLILVALNMLRKAIWG